ncbi:MAG: peptidoglycan DD-metalloendopeptidase family protein [Candidatus Eremiobacteraeota bacterium]|nr:peptidoglycan DD-metalloendopeptidase family protein [Candidatus Eremiobacteraeota bacterium]
MIKLKERYFVKIVPPRGETVHRFEVTRRHIVSALVLLAVILTGSVGFHFWRLHQSSNQVAALQALTAQQHAQLTSIDKQTETLRSQLQKVQTQNQQIQQAIGIRPKHAPGKRLQKTAWVEPAKHPTADQVETRLDQLSTASKATVLESNSIKRLALRILNVRHLEAIARVQLIAAIPSIDPVVGAPIVGCYCYRSYPDSEFHPGVDLGADYGQTVRASAAGVVASSDWDGGYGLKVDIDHGNGYHTWYAHLSASQVHPGERVYKGEPIALVGSTGFSTGPHLHYQVMLNGSPTDPTPYLNGVPPKVLASL